MQTKYTSLCYKNSYDSMLGQIDDEKLLNNKLELTVDEGEIQLAWYLCYLWSQIIMQYMIFI